MAAVIGRADEFYRLRVIRVDESDVPDLEWRDDVLYRKPTAQRPGEYDVWRVEAVSLDTDEVVAILASFESSEEAHGWVEDISDDLATMMRSEFERAYFPADRGESGD